MSGKGQGEEAARSTELLAQVVERRTPGSQREGKHGILSWTDGLNLLR